jgi:hypothetical protein
LAVQIINRFFGSGRGAACPRVAGEGGRRRSTLEV